jgi:hypothetical protein
MTIKFESRTRMRSLQESMTREGERKFSRIGCIDEEITG